MSPNTASLLSSRRLARNAVWNFLGLAAPLLVAIFAVPLLIEGMGKERFGLLTIIWMGIGYFSLFDMGLGRALTKLVAEHLGRNEPEKIRGLIWTALWLIFGLGLVAMMVVLGLSEYLVTHVLNVPENLQNEGRRAFYVLGVGLPLVTQSTALTGILEAHQRFRGIAIFRGLLGAFTFIAPLMVLPMTSSLVAVTAALLAVRFCALVMLFIHASKSLETLLQPLLPGRSWFLPLFSMGGWLTVTNIVSPIMVYFDRFFIGSLLTLTAVTYYVTPYEVLSRILIVPAAIMGVAFPAMATAFVSDKARMAEIYAQVSRLLLLAILPLVVIASFFAPEWLMLWLGADFSRSSAVVVHWLAAGVLINALAHPAHTVLQSSGRADLSARLHLAELLPYLGLLWILTLKYGIAGTAAAWTLRVVADAALMYLLAVRVLPEIRQTVNRVFIVMPGLAMLLILAVSIDSIFFRGIIALVVCAVCGALLLPSIRKLVISV